MAKTILIFSLAALFSSTLGSPFDKLVSQPGGKLQGTRNDVINYFNSISGNAILTGQHNREPNSDPTKWTRVVEDITGVLPALWGGDFLFLLDDVKNRQTMVDETIKQWNAGSFVALTWHVCPPTVAETCDWDNNGILSHLNDAQWSELIQDGSNLNNLWKARLDTIVPYLKQLQNAGLVVIWRPIHEMNEGWSWWGGRPGANGSLKLYQIVHDYFTKYHGLDNLIWTWCVKDTDMGNVGSYWPGTDYVDIASLDIWVNQFPKDEDYQTMISVANGKPIALAEVGSVPTPSILQRQNRWVWFMVWAEYLKDPSFNSDQGIKDTYYMSNVYHQGDINLGDGSGSDNIARGQPVVAGSIQNASYPAVNAVDGNLNTRWASDFSAEQFIYVDLKSNKNIKQVKLYWEDAYAVGYQIQTSTDESSWTTVYEDYNGNGGTDTINLSANARFVKVYMFERAGQYGYSLYEIEIFA